MVECTEMMFYNTQINGEIYKMINNTIIFEHPKEIIGRSIGHCSEYICMFRKITDLPIEPFKREIKGILYKDNKPIDGSVRMVIEGRNKRCVKIKVYVDKLI